MIKRVVTLIICTVVLLVALFNFNTFANNVSISPIGEKEAGTTISIGGIATMESIKVDIYQPGKNEVWQNFDVKVNPNQTFSIEVKLPADVLGEYKVKAVGVEQTFNVIKKKTSSVENSTTSKTENIGSTIKNDNTKIIEGIKVFVDGNLQHFSTPAKLIGEDVMVPVKDILEILGAKYTYNEASKTVTATVSAISFEIKADIKANALTSLKPIAEAFGFRYSWDTTTKKAVVGTKEKKDWWFKYPTQAESQFVDATDARSSRSNYGANFTWGTLLQMSTWEDTKTEVQDRAKKGTKLVSYFEASGTAGAFAVGYNKTPKEGINSIFNISAWGMATVESVKSQKYITFTGLHNDVNNDVSTKNLFTRESLGYTIPKYPDGKEALGYLTDPNIPYPVNAKIYDMACAKGISGFLTVDYSMPYPGTGPVENMANVKIGTGTLLAYSGKSAGDIVTFMGVGMEKDPAAPFWKENNKVTAKYFMQYKMDGAWFDNMSPWDNFQPVLNGFGEWSEKLFNDFLSEKFTADKIKEMGIADISKFNIRKYVWDKALAMGAINPDDPNDIVYRSYKWMSDPIWNAYKVFKKNVGRSYLQDVYKSMKDAATVAGYKNGFMVSGNDMPSLNHGWMEDGWMDVCATEINTGWSLTFGARGIMDVPQGKMAILERAALETQSGPYPIIWFYSDDKLKDKTETGKVLLAEAFANSCFIKRADNTVGTDSSHKWLNDFAYKEETTFGTRYMNYDIAILDSTEDQLGATMPGSIQGNLDNQLHMQGLWGFSHALVDAHIPYRVIPTWKVSSQTLKTLHTLIMPNVEHIDDSMLPILEEFVNNGGRLVITGPAGLRKGFDGMLAKRDKALLSDLVGRDISKAPGVDMTASSEGDDTIYTNKVGKGEVVWVATPIGHNYFMNYDSRPDILPKILNMVGGTSIFDGSKLPLTVGSFLWKSTDGSDLFVDLVNYNVENATDKVTSAKDLTFKIKLPEGTTAVKALALSPDIYPKTANYESQIITADVKDGWATVTIPEVKIYTSIKLSTKETVEEGGIDNTLLIVLISLFVIVVGVAIFILVRRKRNNVL